MGELQVDAGAAAFAAACVAIDLEVGQKDATIHQFAAVRGDRTDALVFRGGDFGTALEALDRFTAGQAWLVGHNLIAFDGPHLAAARPDLALLRLPALDTLWLNPLAFPRNPYHHLVKHYQDGQIARGRVNDPEHDARLTLRLLGEQFQAFRQWGEQAPERLLAWHWLTTAQPSGAGFDAFFHAVRGQARPDDSDAERAIGRLLAGRGCEGRAREAVRNAATQGWPLAYALAWLAVAEGNSVMPPWVRHQFPAAARLVQDLRDRRCDDPTCAWCRERHDPIKELTRYFGFEAFRPEPRGADGRPLQEAIVEAAMQGRHVLGILPTGTGKSLCYQIPALSRFDKTGALTVVISPLVALMADQVSGLQARGITACAAVNGLLSMPERAEVLDRVRLGDVGILIISPEQLRNRAVRRVLAQREIGAWVLDEAHCISKWGHDFRPDYRYVGRFIRENAGEAPVPPILCLTATAKPDVVEDMVRHFADKLDVTLEVFNGGANRTNLSFEVLATREPEKLADVHAVLAAGLPEAMVGGAIVYCSTRRHTEEVAQFLLARGLAAGYFHAGLPPEAKKSVQERFIRGELRVIAATNAFGMGIDKPDVRLVIHADVPGSLENYLQEAGRAGRDRDPARCVLLYTNEDVERQFGMSARSRLTQREIQAILAMLKRLDRKKRFGGVVVATVGEILATGATGEFERDTATDDTRVRTAIAWLEEATLLTREENVVHVFPSTLRVASLDEARARCERASVRTDYRAKLLRIVAALIGASPDDGITTDELSVTSGLSAEELRKAFYDLEQLGIASNDTALTAFVHAGVERSSVKRLAAMEALEIAFLEALREADPEVGKGDRSVLRLRAAAQTLRDLGHADARPDTLWRLVRSVANDGRRDEGGVASWQARRLDGESIELTLHKSWDAILETARLRRAGATRLLEHLLGSLPVGARGTDLTAETTLGKLVAAIEADADLKARLKEPGKLMDRALMWLHEQEVIRLNKGLAVFRPAMTIQLGEERRGFLKADFVPLQLHYEEQVTQIHVMAEYVKRGLQHVAEALSLARDYFDLGREAFLAKWLPGRSAGDLVRQTTPESWRAIVEPLSPSQREIVVDDREQTNVLVLAGPGSGKTRVLVHRIAYLVRVRRVDPGGILALAYNRHAAVEIRRRLAELIGDDARGVTVLTCHALAMRLAGVSFEKRARQAQDSFDAVLDQAIALLKGDGLEPEEADDQRERLLAGFRWILVDEYQDIGPRQYELISALAGRTLQDEEGRLSLFAVGDDDQNIYAFNGASVEYIQRFEADYGAKLTYLTENYRSTAHIVEAANHLIQQAASRMKVAQPITLDRARRKEPVGGPYRAVDPVGQGRVQVLRVPDAEVAQAVAAIQELERLAALDPAWSWARCAVVARNWKYLMAVRAYCEQRGIPAQLADEDPVNFWRLRETQALVQALTPMKKESLTLDALRAWGEARPAGPWWDLLRDALEDYAAEIGRDDLPADSFLAWLWDWGREYRRKQTGLLLMTAHRAKGLEFDHVAVLDGGWTRTNAQEDLDAPRRLYYVAMTRARRTLTLVQGGEARGHLAGDLAAGCFQVRSVGLPETFPRELGRVYRSMGLNEVDLGFAGRQAPDAAVHGAIAALLAGDPIRLRFHGAAWELVTVSGEVVGKMAKAFAVPPGLVWESGRVAAIVQREKTDGDAVFQTWTRCDRWETVIPELVFSRPG